jgi:protein N-terminal glutamine amidohydrolase
VTTKRRYQSCFCEENVWHLAGDADLADKRRLVAFVSNPARACAVWSQRAARAPDEPVVWDYHVVLFVQDGAWRAYDLDSRVPLGAPLSRWVDASFPRAVDAPPELAPRFRVVDGDAYRRDFASDRSHMKDERGRWRAPPPPWPPIGDGHRLDDFVDVVGAGPGEIWTLDRLRAFAAEDA